MYNSYRVEYVEERHSDVDRHRGTITETRNRIAVVPCENRPLDAVLEVSVRSVARFLFLIFRPHSTSRSASAGSPPPTTYCSDSAGKATRTHVVAETVHGVR